MPRSCSPPSPQWWPARGQLLRPPEPRRHTRPPRSRRWCGRQLRRAYVVAMYSRHEMQDVIVIDGRARGIVVRDMVTGEISSHPGDAVVLATGGYGNAFFLSTNATGCNAPPSGVRTKTAPHFAQPLLHADPPHLHPRQRRAPVEADPDVRVACATTGAFGSQRKEGCPPPRKHPETRGTTTWQAQSSELRQPLPRDISSRAAKQACDEGRGVGPTELGVYLDFADAIKRLGEEVIRERYGNLFDMYKKSPTRTPTNAHAHLPRRSLHHGRALGRLQFDDHPAGRLLVLGEANFSDHGANRLGACALMQGLADGYFILPYTIGNYFASSKLTASRLITPSEATGGRTSPRGITNRLLASTVSGLPPPAPRPRQDACGQLRYGTERDWITQALAAIPALREEFWSRRAASRGRCANLNPCLEHAGRVADFLEFGELMCLDALTARVLRRPLPRGIPDRRRRGANATTRTSATSPRGSTRRRASRPCATSSRWRSTTSTSRPGATSEPDAERVAADARGRSRSDSLPTRSTTSAPTCRSSRCSTCVNECSSPRATSRSRSTTIAAKASAATCGVVINGMPARPARPHDRLPAAHAHVQGRRHD